MAGKGKPVGEIVISLDLDPTAYTAAQKRILAGSKEAIGGIEQNWAKLGSKSDAYFDNMRKSYENSSKLITTNAKSTTAEIERAYAALNVKLKALDDERNVAEDKRWQMFGTRSDQAINEQKQKLMNNYDILRKRAEGNSTELIRLEAAKNHQLKTLNDEMVGHHEMSMASMTRAVLRFYAAYYIFTQAAQLLTAPLKMAIQYLATIETATLGIAASFMTGGKFIDQTTGKVLEGSAALAKAQVMSKELIKELQYANLQTIATLDQLIVAYQATLPVALAKGFNVKQVKDFTLAMVQAAGAIGLPMDQMAEETRSLLTGSINPRNSRIATVLGLRNEDIAKYKSDAQGLFDFLMAKLDAYKVAGIEAQNTWAGLTSNMKDIMGQFFGKAFDPLFEAIKYQMQEWIKDIVTLDEKTKTITWNKSFLDGIETIKNGITAIIAEMYRLGATLDLVGQGMAGTQMFLAGPGAALGLESSKKKFEAAAQSYLDYGKRMLASDKALQDLAMRSQGFKSTTADTKGATSVTTELGQVLYYYKAINEEKTKYQVNDPKKEISKETESATKKLVEDTRKANLDIAQFGKERSLKELEEMDSVVAKARSKGVDEITIAKYVAAEKGLIAKKTYDEESKYWVKIADEEISLLASLNAALNENMKEEAKIRQQGLDLEIQYWSEYADEVLRILNEEQQAVVDAEKRRIEIIDEQVNYYKDLAGFESIYYEKKLAQIEEVRQAEIRAGKDVSAANAKASEARKEAANVRYMKPMQDALGEWSTALENISKLYEEGSASQKRYHDLSVAFALAQKGFDTANAVVKGVEAVINAMANGDGYTAIARGLAVAAVVASYLAQIGASFSGGGSGSSTSSAAYGQNTTVLGGANGQGSESISKSWELLQDTYTMEDTKLTGIYNQMKDLNQNITGLVTGIVRNYGSFSGIQTVETVNQFAPLLSWAAEKGGSYSLVEKIFGNLGTKLFNAIDSMLWGGSKTSSTASGLSITGGNVQSYTDILKETSWSVFGGAGSDERSTVYGAIDEELTNLFSGPDGIYTNLTKTFGELAKGFGTDTQTALNYIFADAKINLQGLDAEGVQKAVSEFISKAGDEAVKSLFGKLISQYQQIGEGLLETAVRLVIDKESVLSALEMTGQAFSGTAMEAVAFSESLINLAGGLDKLTEAASTYYDKFFSDAEKQTRLQKQLADNLGLVPGSRADYRKAVELLDLSNAADRERYVLMLQLAEAADQYYSTLEDSLKDATNAQNDYIASLKNISLTINSWLNNLSLSSLSPVQSEAEWTRQYMEAKAKAGAAGATEKDVNDYLSFATKYLEMQQKYGTSTSYKAIYDAVVGDVTGMGKGKDLALELAQKQLDALNIIATNTGITAVSGLPGALPGQTLVNSQYGQTGLDDSVIELLKGAATGDSPSPYWSMSKAKDILNQFGIPYAAGGYADSPSMFGERGGEWAVPTYEPQRKNFLKSAPQAFWDNLGLNGGSNGPGGEVTVHNHIYIDGKEIQYVVTKGMKTNSDLIASTKRAVS